MSLGRFRTRSRRLTLVGAGLGLCLIAAPAGALVGANSHVALAAAGGNNNKGDVWVDNVGQPSGPGHEMDPHLACADINLWGDKLADPSGTYTVDGWPPSGSKEQDWPASGPGSWNYDQGKGGSQVMDVINVDTLIDDAVANGDAVHNKQGFHFKLQFSADPHKHKTFWVQCPDKPGPTPTPTPTPTPNPGTPNLVLSKTASPASGAVPVNTIITYTITLQNTSGTAASNVRVDDKMSGNAAFTVNDGMNDGTTNSFVGNPTVTINKDGTGQYHWTYASVPAHASDTVTYTAVIQSPGSTTTALNGTFTLVNTAFADNTNCPDPDVPACTVSHNFPPPSSQVQGITTGTPGTGVADDLRLAVTGFLVLGGLGMVLLGLLVKEPVKATRKLS